MFLAPCTERTRISCVDAHINFNRLKQDTVLIEYLHLDRAEHQKGVSCCGNCGARVSSKMQQHLDSKNSNGTCTIGSQRLT